MKTIPKILVCVFMVSLLWNCVDPIPLETIATERLLVVEATLTNENKQQTVLLSRTTALEDTIVNRVSNAIVTIVDKSDNIYSFTENSPGIYLSNESFAAQPNIEYKLEITTALGNSYFSTWQRYMDVSDITNVYAETTTNEKNEQGISIFVDTRSLNGSGYFKYEYEETFQIIAPNWSPLETVIVSRDRSLPVVDLRVKEEENRVCYKNSSSTNIILASTDNLGSGQLNGFPLRFIKSNNYLFQNRYSILVKQFSQNIEAFEFYSVLRDLSTSENLFTELQPGFVVGNISPVTNNEENVVGFFNVSSVVEKRIFLNYSDFFMDDEPVVTNFPSNCIAIAPSLFGRNADTDSPLITALDLGWIFYQDVSDVADPPINFFGPYSLVPRVCGDCTVLGSNIVPDFWLE